MRSLNHAQVLVNRDSSKKAVRVQQTRLTNLGIHTLVLMTLFAMNLLEQLSLAVLHGVSMYMRITGLSGNQFGITRKRC